MLKIVYNGNDAYFDGLYLSILSILRRSKETFSFYLLSGDFTRLRPNFTNLTNEHEKRLIDLVKSYNKNNEFKRLDCTEAYEVKMKGNLSEKSHYSPYAGLHLLIDQFDCFKTGKVLYLNIDIMLNKDIKAIFDIDMKDNEVLVAHDALGKYWLNKNYFNNGVVLFNMDVCSKNNIFEKARNFMKTKIMYFPDQSALNKSVTKVMYFPKDEMRFNNQTRKIHDDTIVKHFCAHIVGWPKHHNIKQWDIEGVHKYLKMHTFDEDFEIFLKDKEKHKKKRDEKFFISINHLKKRYGKINAVDDVSFKVKKGSLFAFLGINGAGKSTTINIISSTLKKDSGEIYIGDYNLDIENYKIKKLIGIVFQNSTLDGLLTVEENLKIRGKFYQMPKNELNESLANVTKMLHLEPILKQEVRNLSGGQRRRVDIARALIHKPQLLLLDEPTTGLDPKTRQDVWRLIDDIRKKTNMTVFLTTHYLEEAEKATYVVIMNKGKIIAEGTPVELKNKYSSDYVISYQKKNVLFEEKIKGCKYYYDKDADAYRISVKNSEEAKEFIVKHPEIVDFEIQKGNMDDVFLTVTGEKR